MTKLPNHCDRCGQPGSSHKMSWFDNDMICPACQQGEQEHPEYKKARDAEELSLRRGERNFSGIGLPQDLKAKYKK